MNKTLSRNEIISLIKAEKPFLKENFGVIHIGIFGSYAKDRQTIDSDIDFLVEFEEPRFDWIAGLYIYLEKKFDRKIEIINLIKAEKPFLKENFGVIHIGIFGSYAKNRQTIDSDIDFLVEFEEPRFDWIAGLNIYLEKKFDRKIEIIRKRALKKSKFFERIEQEVIYV